MSVTKALIAVGLVLVVVGTAGAVTPPPIPGGVDYLHSRNEDNGATYVADGNAAGTLAPGQTFTFDPRSLPHSGGTVFVAGTGSVSHLEVTKFPAPGAIGSTEDTWGLVSMYQTAPGFITNPGVNGTQVGAAGPIFYDNSAGDKPVTLTGMFWGGQDISVTLVAGSGDFASGGNGIPLGDFAEIIRTQGAQFDLWAVPTAGLNAAATSNNLMPYDANLRTSVNKYVGWTGNTIAGSTQLFDGNLSYQQGTTVVDPTGFVVGSSLDATTVYLNVDGANVGAAWNFLDTNKFLTPDGNVTDMWFQWTLSNSFAGWTVKSDDIGGGDSPVPEPITMLGVLLSIGGVGGYIRRRRLAA